MPPTPQLYATQKVNDLKAIGYAQCELDVWTIVEALDLPLTTRLELITQFENARRFREVTQFQLTESDLNALL